MFMYSKIVFFSFLLFGLGCQKKQQDYDRIVEQEKALVASKQEAFEKVQKYLAKQFPNEQLIGITDLSFVHGSRKLVALIFYQTQTGEHNLVIEQTIGDNEMLLGEKLSTCYGDSCTCKVRVVVDNQGNVDVGCNCSSCYMVTTDV
jgi:hypothetical protein